MPLDRLAIERGFYRPDELELLRRVFDKLVNVDLDAGKREALASRIISNYMTGIKDEEELISLSKQPFGR